MQIPSILHNVCADKQFSKHGNVQHTVDAAQQVQWTKFFLKNVVQNVKSLHQLTQSIHQ